MNSSIKSTIYSELESLSTLAKHEMNASVGGVSRYIPGQPPKPELHPGDIVGPGAIPGLEALLKASEVPDPVSTMGPPESAISIPTLNGSPLSHIGGHEPVDCFPIDFYP